MFRLCTASLLAGAYGGGGGGLVDLNANDCGGGTTIATLQSISPTAVKLGEQTELTFNVGFSDTFVDGTFDIEVIVPNHAPVKDSISACTPGNVEMPMGSGNIFYPGGNVCPFATGSQQVVFQVWLNETIPSLLDQLKINVDMKREDGTEAMCATMQTNKLGCEHFFGDMSGLITIVDPDVPDDKCADYGATAPCSFVHYSGSNSDCVVPAPPEGCHRYTKVRYDSCAPLEDGRAMRWSHQMDREGRFGADGVLTECAGAHQEPEVHCWGPPAGNSQQCTCPGPAPPPPTTEIRLITQHKCRTTPGCTQASSVLECEQWKNELFGLEGHRVRAVNHNGRPNGCYQYTDLKESEDIIYQDHAKTKEDSCDNKHRGICKCTVSSNVTEFVL